MQLKRLEIKGFKSFADKTVLDFTGGITAVVGPNGSGKSNIIEAIRWVMGEQSARTLRGGRMHDVIFAGSDSRKPINIAEVTLVLDNEDDFLPIDFEEVSVTRRINRNGDSDYFINRESCRLKDIVDLFMDSGLGKESFSIISQGQVEAIFNSKAEDRRAIFEEAAGVLKYKKQKEKAERKLFETQDNLDRVQDILFELKGQVEPLKEQKDKAESYVNQKEELTDLDIALSVMKIDEYVAEQKESKDKIEHLTQQATHLTEQMEEQAALIKEKKGLLQDLKARRDLLQEKTIESVQLIERTEARLRLVEEKERHKDAFLSEKQASIQKEMSLLESLQTELKETSAEHASHLEAIKAYKLDHKRLEDQLHRLMGNKEEAMEALRSDYIEAMQSKTSFRNEETYLERQLQQATVSSDKHKQSMDAITEKMATTQALLTDKEAQLAERSKEIDDLLRSYAETKEILDQIQESFSQKTQRLQQLTNQLHRAQAKQASLIEMQENYAGYFAGVKAVMKAKHHLSGIVGTVADQIDVPTDYTEAIDIVLGSASQFVIVEDEKAGREAIQHLKQKKAGRATFLPLTTIKKRYLSATYKSSAQTVDGYIGVASELIQFDEKVAPVIENLLGNTIVAKDLQSANTIARSVQFNVRVVSLDGDVMNAGGSMTGGGGKRSSNAHLFSQKKEEKALRIEIDELEKTIQLREKDIEEDRESVSRLTKDLEKKRQLGEDKRLEEKQLENEVSQLKETATRLEREKKGLLYEQDESTADVSALIDQLKTIRLNLKEAEDTVERIHTEMTHLSSEKEDRETQKERIESERQAILDKWNDEREALASIRTRKESLENQIHQTQETIRALQTDREEFEKGEALESKEELEATLHTLKDTLASLKEEERELRDEQGQLEETVAQLEEKNETAAGKRTYLLDEKNALDIQYSRHDVSIDHLLEYLSEEYAISYEEAKLNQPAEINREETQKRVKLLKKGIEELGPVNLSSIEEYERVSERYEFLSTQQHDLLEAKEQLYDTMDQMDQEVKKRFFETFSQVKEQFAIVFPRMFGGGKAELRLTDPNDLLHSGIEIIAQPPGKRLQSLSLLSGGERALTALSLLFAIIEVRPIPFCILDEAEAALDEANVTRFGRYLHEFATDTQFIVITHRKGTMEEADSLYGVTMKEKGVSKLVSVHLKEIEEQLEENSDGGNYVN
ncbi:chromosome segregation protein SMC [Alkalibacterium iburiense]|uniref:Chromosome partition protein Smc n=1 Tax=Alkalibacterium iburiense TaxID=290589 RepID=A0ABP3GWE6_9LACT